jgi:hypothetical protein
LNGRLNGRQGEKDEKHAGQVHAAQQVGERHERHAGAEEQHRYVSTAEKFAPDNLSRGEGGDVKQVGVRLLPLGRDADANVERDEQDARTGENGHKRSEHRAPQLLIHISFKALADEETQRGDEKDGQEQQQNPRDRPTADRLAQFLDDHRV